MFECFFLQIIFISPSYCCCRLVKETIKIESRRKIVSTNQRNKQKSPAGRVVFVIAQYKIIAVQNWSPVVLTLLFYSFKFFGYLFIDFYSFLPFVALNKLPKHGVGFYMCNQGFRWEFDQEQAGSKRTHHLLHFITTVITPFNLSKK